VGGSGDVLSGVVAALLARRPLTKFSSDKAAALGAWLHGRAGEICAHQFPAGGNLAGDIAEALPKALAELF
jgi:NAD(P)H-hydrate epimerase